MEFHDPPRFPRGFRCASRHCGLKAAEPDLSLFVSERPARAAALFTRNHFPGAPIQVGRERIQGGSLQAIVANSKVSNVATGEQGLDDARRMGLAAARELGISDELVLMSSTGVIGRRLPIDRIEEGIRGIAGELGDDPLAGARGIMTTDSHPKAISTSIGDATLTAVGKGAGMVAPNLATMLVFLFTDGELSASALHDELAVACGSTFGRLSIDTDTSTSDTVAILANGLAGPVDRKAFGQALQALCLRMAEMIARDGEGATKLLRVRVRGGASDAEADTVARTVCNSPLVKTMAFGADPNIGRVLMAIGKCFECRIVPEAVAVWLQDVEVVRAGVAVPFDDPALRELLTGDPVEVRIDLGVGEGEGLALGCDLTEGYIRENAAYASS